jgi:putative membrane protein
MDMMAGMPQMMVVGTIVTLAIVVTLGFLVWSVLRRLRTTNDEALAILRERYARGEITRDEFESRHRDLAA